MGIVRQYQRKQEPPVNSELMAALRALQEDAKRAGLDKMSQRAINAEIAAHRRQQQKRTRQRPVG